MGTYFSFDPDFENRNLRRTFVMAGRTKQADGSELRVPNESDGGRVILVVPYQDEERAKKWITSFCDVLSIRSLDTSDRQVAEGELGKIIARRLATFVFAHANRLNHLMMIDDNVEKFYVSEHLGVNTWADLYNKFKEKASESNYVCLSAMTYNYRKDKERPDAKEIEIKDDEFGSKIFFFDTHKIFTEELAKEISPKFLQPGNPNLPCGDFFMRYILLYSGLSVGYMSRETILFQRSAQAQNLCVKNSVGLQAWSEIKYEQYPYFVVKTYKKIQQEIASNKIKHQHNQEEFDAKNLQSLDQKYDEERLKRSERPLPDDSLDSEKINSRKKRKGDVKPTIIPSSGSLEKANISPAKHSNASENSFDLFKNKLLYDLRRALQEDRFKQNLGLKEHQNEALEALAEHLEKGKTRGYFEMGTGTGKSYTFLSIALLAYLQKQEQESILIIVPQQNLVDQTYDAWRKLLERGRIQKTIEVLRISALHTSQEVYIRKSKNETGKIVIACADSWSKAMENSLSIENYPLIILEECHDIKTKLRSELDSKSSIILGFSATPEKVKSYLQDRIYEISAEEAVRRKIICPWIVNRLPKLKISDLFNRLSLILRAHEHPNGGTLATKKGLIFVRSIENVDKLTKKLKENGLKARAIHTNVNDSSREARKKEFKATASEVNILVADGMLKQGFDAQVDWVIVLKEALPKDEWTQLLGRCLRISDEERSTGNIKKIAYMILLDSVPENNLPQGFHYSLANTLKTEKSYDGKWPDIATLTG